MRTRTKLVNNFLAISYCQMNAEALSLMVLGLELAKTLDVLYGQLLQMGSLWSLSQSCQGTLLLALPLILRIRILACCRGCE